MSLPRHRHVTKLAALTLSSVLLLTACDGVKERKAKYFEQAEQSFSAQDYDKAKLGFKNVIQIDPKDIAARIGLAKVMVAEQNWRAAAGQYAGVLEVDPTHTAASIELGKLYLLARAQDLALAEAEKVLEREPDHHDALTLKGGVLAQQGELIPARSLLERVHQDAPAHLDSALLLANVLAASLEQEAALQVLDTALKHHPQSIDLMTVKVGIYAGLEQHDRALAVREKIIATQPDNFAHKQALVAYLGQLGRVDEAEQRLQAYIAADDRNIAARKTLVDLLVAQQKTARAETLLNEYREAFPEHADFKLGLARVFLLQDKPADAMSVWNAMIAADERSPAALLAKNEKARYLLAEGQTEQAAVLLDEVIQANTSDRDALLMRGAIAANASRFQDAVADYRVVLKNDPDDAQVLRALAAAHFDAREMRLAENYYKQLVTRFPADMMLRDRLASIHAGFGKHHEAIALREEIQRRMPATASNHLALAKLYVNVQDSTKLQSLAEAMLQQAETAASGHYFAGLAAQMQTRHAVALEHFDASLSIQGNAVEPISAKVKLLLQLERQAEAKTWLQSQIEQQKNNAVVRNLLAEILLLEKAHVAAREQLEQAIALSPAWPIPYRNLAMSYKAENNQAAAMATLQKGIENGSADTIALRTELAQLLEASGDIDAAIAQYETIHTVANAPAFAANNLAMLLVTYKEDEASLERAVRVAEALRGSTNPMFLDTLGWVYFKRNQVDLALPLMREAAEKAPHVAQINYHLALAYHAKNNTVDAVSFLRKALASEQSFVGKSDAQALLNELQGAAG